MAHGAIRDRELPFEYLGCVVSNPRAELAVDNAKYIKACTELHLAGKKIEVIWGFDRFVNLEELWLNNNKVRAVACEHERGPPSHAPSVCVRCLGMRCSQLTAIENLESNFRLKKVYAHDNQITCVCCQAVAKLVSFRETSGCACVRLPAQITGQLTAALQVP